MAICKLCGKERVMFKFGCCQTCYVLSVEKRYKLKDNIKYRVDSQIEMVEEFLANQKMPKIELAKKYGVSLVDVYYNIKKYCDVFYVRKENNIDQIK